MTETESMTIIGADDDKNIALPPLNRSSDTNLLDSCVDDEDDEDDNSVKACGSEEYAQYIDHTGRLCDSQQQQQPKSTITENGTTNASPTPTNHPNIGIILGSTTPTSPMNAITPDNMMTYTPPPQIPQMKQDKTQMSPVKRNVSVSPPGMDGIKFDINQPWERSLLRQLEVPLTGVVDVKTPPNPEMLPLSFLLPTSPKPNEKQHLHNLHQQQSEPHRMVLLGHTESRDYAMDYDNNFDDTISLETNSTCPPTSKRMQFIHRSLYDPPEPHVVFHIASSNDETDHDHVGHNNNHHFYPKNYQYPTASNYYHANNYNHTTPPVYNQHYQLPQHPPKYIKRNNYYPAAAASTLTYDGTNITEDGRDDNNEMMTISIPNKQHYQQHYLEMEAESTDVSTTNNNIEHYAAHNPDMNNIPDPGCFCLGYNMLEYIISSSPPNASKQQQQRKRYGNKNNSTNNGVLHPVRLPMVNEIDNTSTSMIMNFVDNDNNPIIHDESMAVDMNPNRLRRNINNNNTNNNMYPNEPDGIYVQPTDQYYTTNSYDNNNNVEII